MRRTQRGFAPHPTRAVKSADSKVATPLHGEIAPFRLISPLMRFPPQAVIGGSSLDPLLRKLLDTLKEQASRCCLERKVKLASVLLLARRLKAANPDAKHPGKAEE